MIAELLENALVVKVGRDHVTEATRELMGEGWLLIKADMRADPAVFTVQRDPALPEIAAAKAEQMRKRIELVYGRELRPFFTVPIGRRIRIGMDGCETLCKVSSTAASTGECYVRIDRLQLVECLL